MVFNQALKKRRLRKLKKPIKQKCANLGSWQGYPSLWLEKSLEEAVVKLKLVRNTWKEYVQVARYYPEAKDSQFVVWKCGFSVLLFFKLWRKSWKKELSQLHASLRKLSPFPIKQHTSELIKPSLNLSLFTYLRSGLWESWSSLLLSILSEKCCTATFDAIYNFWAKRTSLATN